MPNSNAKTDQRDHEQLEADKKAFLLFCVVHGLKRNAIDGSKAVAYPLSFVFFFFPACAFPEGACALGFFVGGLVGGPLGVVSSPARMFYLYKTRNIKFSTSEVVGEFDENKKFNTIFKRCKIHEDQLFAHCHYQQKAQALLSLAPAGAEPTESNFTNAVSQAKSAMCLLDEKIAIVCESYSLKREKFFKNPSAASSTLFRTLQQSDSSTYSKAKAIIAYCETQSNARRTMYGVIVNNNSLLDECCSYVKLHELLIATDEFFKAKKAAEEKGLQHNAQRSNFVERFKTPNEPAAAAPFDQLVKNILKQYQPSCLTSSDSSKALYSILSDVAMPRSEKALALSKYMTRRSEYIGSKTHLYNQGKKLFNVIMSALSGSTSSEKNDEATSLLSSSVRAG